MPCRRTCVYSDPAVAAAAVLVVAAAALVAAEPLLVGPTAKDFGAFFGGACLQPFVVAPPAPYFL